MTDSTVKTDKSQIGVIGNHVTIEGGIHFHQFPPAAASEKRKDSGNTDIRCKPVKVFISYAREDIDTARRLYADLKMAGIVPWMDKIDLLPGQNWKFHITKAIRESSFFIALLSSKSLSKRGFVQKELKLALDILGEFSDEDVFFIPARVDDCQPEDEKLKYLNWADLFPSYEAGRDDILRVFQQYAASEKTEETAEPAVIPSVKPGHERSETVIESVSEPEKEFTNSLGMKFVYIPPGTFMMGSPPEEPGRSDDEILHKVTLTKEFYMQTTQVTQKQWKAVMGNNPSHFKDCDDCPVENVSWNDVQEFLKKLNGIEKKDLYRLPTEAEWEYACRAGSETAYCFGNDAGKLKEYAWHGRNSGGKTHPVAQLASNAWGLYDMHGNVWEWCQDSCDYKDNKTITDTYKDGITDPINTSGLFQVYRGGCWFDGAQYCRSACRRYDYSGSRGYSLGFRVQMS